MKRIFLLFLVVLALNSYGGDWPSELDDADIVFRVIEGSYKPRETWGADAAVLKMTTGMKDENVLWNMNYNFQDGGDLYYFDLYKSGVRQGYCQFDNADSTPKGTGPANAVITPTSYSPNTDECKANLAKYMNLDFVIFNNPMETNWACCNYGITYYNSKLKLTISGRDGTTVNETKTITGTGAYVFGNGAPSYAVIEVLKYVDYSPKIVKTTGSYFNGVNYVVKFDDLIEKAFSGNAFTVTDVSPHSSISINSAGKFFYIALSDKPITEKAVAKYNFKVSNGYATVESELAFTLYPSSLVINSATGGNTNPSPGMTGGVPGDTLVVTATPDDTHTFTKWEGTAVTAGNESNNPITVTFTDSQLTLTPVYAEVPYVERFNLDFAFNPLKGKVTVNDTAYDSSSTVRLEKGTLVKLKATANTGYKFTSWDGDISAAFKEDDYVEFFMNADMSIAAIFSVAETTTSTTTTTSGSYTTLGSSATSSSKVSADTAALTAALNNLSKSNSLSSGSNSSGSTKTGASSFKEAYPFGSSTARSGSGSSKGSLSSKSGDGGMSRGELKRISDSYGSDGKYKAYTDHPNSVDGAVYYSTEEVENTREVYGAMNSLLGLIGLGGSK